MFRLITPLLLTLGACVAPADPDPDPDPEPEPDPDPDPDPQPEAPLVQCTGRAFTPDAPSGWDHTASALTAALGAPRHDAADRLATTPMARTATLAAKFTYGSVRKDLEDEWVRVYVDDCAAWTLVGDVRTDSDGRATIALGRDLAPGLHEVRFVVRGDASMTSATAWILPSGTHLAIFDIDGTLTTSDAELILDVADSIYDGTYVAQAYAGAFDLLDAHVAIGHVPVVLSGRPRWLTQPTRTWLADHGAPAAPLVLAPSNTEALPLESGVGAFKLDTIAGLEAMGFVVDLAYGNASTDIYAYLGAGLPASDAWIIGEHAGEQGTRDPGADWRARAAAVAASASIDQPFAY